MMQSAASATAEAAARLGCRQATNPRRGDKLLARRSCPSNHSSSVVFHRHIRNAGHKLSAAGARTCTSCAEDSLMRNSQGLTAVKWTRRQAWALLSSGTVLMTRAESGLAQEFQKPDANRLLSLAQKRFTESKVEESAELFDQAIQLKPELKQYLWQRGLSLYYARRFEDGSEQFLTDVSLNPNDTEETIWKFLCDAQLVGFNQAQEQMLKVGKDRRPVMRAAYDLFQGNGSTEKCVGACMLLLTIEAVCTLADRYESVAERWTTRRGLIVLCFSGGPCYFTAFHSFGLSMPEIKQQPLILTGAGAASALFNSFFG